MFRHFKLVHNLRAEKYLEIVLGSSAVTVVFIRIFLTLTGFPQLGNSNTLHIAHMLWGGLLMIGVILLFLSFFGRYIHTISALVGGIGFGIFIDEIGKFVTVNNDYFFKPAIPLIYFVFMMLFFLGRYLLKTREPNVLDYMANSLEMIQDLIINKPTDGEFYDRLNYFLKKCGRKNKFTKLIKGFIGNEPVLHHEELKKDIFKDRLEGWYQNMLTKNVIHLGIIIFFVIYTLYNAYNAIAPISSDFKYNFLNLTLFEQLQIFAVVIISMITILGLLEFIFSRIAAYHSLELATYLSLFLLQVFVFYNNQLNGIFGLIISLITLFVIKYLIKLEKHHMRKHVLGKLVSLGKSL